MLCLDVRVNNERVRVAVALSLEFFNVSIDNIFWKGLWTHVSGITQRQFPNLVSFEHPITHK